MTVTLVGYGSAGRGIHGRLLAEVGAPPSVVVTGNPERAGQARADLPGVSVVATLEAALDTAPSLVVIASPTGVHVENAMACVDAGVPTVVDKPLGVDAISVARLVRRASEARVPLTVFQNRRWDAENLTLAAVLASGELGDVHRFERRWERWRPVPKDRWRENADWRHGGGSLLDLGPHLVDSAVHLFGPITTVHAELEAHTTRAEDDVFVSALHRSGVRSHLSAGSLVAAPGPRTRVLGSRGAYVVTEFESEAHVFGGFDDAPGCTGWLVTEPGTSSPVPTVPGSHADFYRAVLAALALPADRRQAAMPVQPQDALHVAAVLDAARVSAAQGRTIDVEVPQV